MLVLGIESTCDETGCSLVLDGEKILSNVVASQHDLHSPFGGVIPELASRRHLEVFHLILNQALKEAGCSLQDIDLIAVAKGPGLMGALLTGIHFAKGLSLSLNIPLVGVNHIEAHIYAAFMGQKVPLPTLGLILSGGHTTLLLVKKQGEYEVIGQTQDDAIGEAFDKVATLLQLPYPGGPEIEKLARSGDPYRFPFKSGYIKDKIYDFSFSGLKTAVLYLLKGQNATKESPLKITEEDKKDVAASFQRAAFDAIIHKTLLAANHFHCQSVVVGGGVSHNKELRRYIKERAPHLNLYWPPTGLSLDNAAMIAGLGIHEFQKQSEKNSQAIEALPNLSF